jgi:hypothetical protein
MAHRHPVSRPQHSSNQLKKKIMALKLVKRNKLRVPINGAIADEDGTPVKFSFVLLCKRVDQPYIDAFLENKKTTVADFVHNVTEGWESVFADDGSVLDFSTENLAQVLEQPGMHVVCFNTYIKEVGAVAKN